VAKHILSIRDFSAAEIVRFVRLTGDLKRGKAGRKMCLAGKSVALIFDKSSTRTRLAFDVACEKLGAHSITNSGANLQIGRGETLEDSGRIFSLYVDAVAWRTSGQDRLERFAHASRVPVINMLSDQEHPCQILADLFTIREKLGGSAWPSVAFIGDCGNNVAHSWLLAAARLGIDFRMACPRGHEPDPVIRKNAEEEAWRTGAKLMVTRDPKEASAGAGVLYTDVWVSMGQEGEKKKRLATFKGYQINSSLLSVAASGAMVMHCLPAHRGEEISAEVLDGHNSVVFDQAHNRLYNAMASLIWVLKGGKI